MISLERTGLACSKLWAKRPSSLPSKEQQTLTFPGMSSMTYVFEQFDLLFQVGKFVSALTSRKDGLHENSHVFARGKRDCSTQHVGLGQMKRGKSTSKFETDALKPSTKQKLTILNRNRRISPQRLMVATAGCKSKKACKDYQPEAHCSWPHVRKQR